MEEKKIFFGQKSRFSAVCIWHIPNLSFHIKKLLTFAQLISPKKHQRKINPSAKKKGSNIHTYPQLGENKPQTLKTFTSLHDEPTLSTSLPNPFIYLTT